jgi:EAL and modified HD-GYP domain-containing signal transduction protein
VLKALLRWLGLAKPSLKGSQAPQARDGFADLNRKAPLRKRTESDPDDPAPGDETFLCREAVLGRDQKVAGYQFMLREGTRNRIRNSSRVVHHVYAEVLVRNLAASSVCSLLGHRLAFVDVPDSFLGHECLSELPPANTVLFVTPLDDPGAPRQEDLLERVRALRKTGFRIGIPDPEVVTEYAPLLPESDFVMLMGAALDPARVGRRTFRLGQLAEHASLIVREVASLELLGYCLRIGAKLFQGPFVTSREDWHENHLSPDMARLALLLGRLRQEADTSEIVTLTKQDPALSLRLLRYINSAASGLTTRVSSIEGALQLLGRSRLYRWLMVLFCSQSEAGGRSAAALEAALVRARMMELLAARHQPAEQEALFLTGLLSLIDVVLQLPMARAIEPLALSPQIDAAVRERSGPYAPLLELAIACEGSETAQIDQCARACGISPAEASTRHIEALGWALELQR